MDNILNCEERLKKIIISDKNNVMIDKVERVVKSEMARLLKNYFVFKNDDLNLKIDIKDNKYYFLCDCCVDSIKTINSL